MNIFEQNASNEDNYKPSRHRTSAITNTVSSIANYPQKLRIYKTNASLYWQVRCFIKDKVHTKSLRTTNRKVAINSAKQFFHQRVAEVYGSKIVLHANSSHEKTVLFKDLVNATLAIERAKAERGEYTFASLNILQNRIYRTVLPFFGDMQVENITYNELNDFIVKLSSNKSSTTTIQQYLVATRKVLNYACASNYIKSIPKFPVIRVSNEARGSFTVSEYKLLVRTVKQNIGREITNLTMNQKKRGRFVIQKYLSIQNELQWLIRFMVNSFVRPSDIKNLQHQHVTVVRNQNTYLRLNLPESKKHDKPIVTMQGAVFAYAKLKLHNEKLNLAKQTDYLFLPNLKDRDQVVMYLGWQFEFIKQLAQIETNASNGQNRTLYSLRHTAITFRLLYGGNIDLLTLARNARTSVEMIEKFYSSNLTSEMNIGLLQSRRK
jgi:integrase